MDQRHSDPQLHATGSSQTGPVTASTSATGGQWPPSSGDHSLPVDASHDSNLEVNGNPSAIKPPLSRPMMSSRVTPSAATPRPVSPFSQALVPSDSTRGRRAQDDFDYQQSQGFPERRGTSESVPESSPLSAQKPAHQSDPAGPAWLYAPSAPQVTPKPIVSQPSPLQS